MFQNETRDIEWIIGNLKTVAVVGISPDPSRPSNWISLFLKERGWRIIPVRPGGEEFFGIKSHASLEEISEPVDLVLIFRRSEFVPMIVDQAIAKKVTAVWMQDGIYHEESAKKAVSSGLKVVMDRCIFKEISRRS